MVVQSLTITISLPSIFSPIWRDKILVNLGKKHLSPTNFPPSQPIHQQREEGQRGAMAPLWVLNKSLPLLAISMKKKKKRKKKSILLHIGPIKKIIQLCHCSPILYNQILIKLAIFFSTFLFPIFHSSLFHSQPNGPLKFKRSILRSGEMNTLQLPIS